MPSTRQQIAVLLEEGPLTARDISAQAGIPEKEVIDHLAHVRRGLRGTTRFRVVPAACLNCGFEFGKRERLTAPGRCPRCRSERVSPPAFMIVNS